MEELKKRRGRGGRGELLRPELEAVVPRRDLLDRQLLEPRGVLEQARAERDVADARLAAGHGDDAGERSRRREVQQQEDVVEEQLDVRRRVAAIDGAADLHPYPNLRRRQLRRPLRNHPHPAVRPLAHDVARHRAVGAQDLRFESHLVHGGILRQKGSPGAGMADEISTRRAGPRSSLPRRSRMSRRKRSTARRTASAPPRITARDAALLRADLRDHLDELDRGALVPGAPGSAALPRRLRACVRGAGAHCAT